MGHAASSRSFPSVTAVHAEAGKPTGIVALGRRADEHDGAQLLVASPDVFTHPPPRRWGRQFWMPASDDGTTIQLIPKALLDLACLVAA